MVLIVANFFMKWFPAARMGISDLAFYGLQIVICFVLVVGSGWFYAMLDPSFPKIEGELNKRVLIQYIAVFVACQIVIAPIVYACVGNLLFGFLP